MTSATSGKVERTPGPWCLDGFNMCQILHQTLPRGHPDAKHTCGDFDVVARAESVADARYIVQTCNAHEAVTTERDTLKAFKALCVEQTKALSRIKSLLDGADNWSPHDVLANANCAYSVAEDAVAAAAEILK